MTEKEFVLSLSSSLESYFDISFEVWSKDRQSRIDILLKLKKEDVYFGVECKIPDNKKGQEIGRYVQQAVKYSNSEFEIQKDIFQRIPIFICPPLSYNYFLLKDETKNINGVEWHKDRHDKENTHHSINGFLSSFGIGEIRHSNINSKDRYIYFSFANKMIFATKKDYFGNIKGLHVKNYDILLNQLGI